MTKLSSLPVEMVLGFRGPQRPLRNIVVVTGPHRSGTTVMGRLLDQASRTFVVHEPFNVDWGLQGVPCRYPYLRPGDTGNPAALVLRHFLTTGDSQWMGNGKPLKAGHPRMRTYNENVRGLRPCGFSVVLKDPFLMLALGWINTSLSKYPPVVTLRHPGAWVSSLQRRNMHPRAAIMSFRDQNAFGDPVVAELLNRRDWEQADLVSSGAATWACLVRMLDVQLEAGARATVVRMEDFAANPHDVLRTLYRCCGLRTPKDLDRIVREYTGDQNIVTPDKRVMHELRRHSSALANAWRTTMSDEDQKTVRQITEPVAEQWYPDW